MVCKPYVGVLTHLAGMRSPPQYPLAIDVARWQGEPVVAVVAQSRAEAEDAVEAGGNAHEGRPPAPRAGRAPPPPAGGVPQGFAGNPCFPRGPGTGGRRPGR